jgi:hypothetical protein
MKMDIEESLKAAWPWTTAFLHQLHNLRPEPFRGSHILFGSDYSGSHAGSRFQIYGFVVADADASPDWPNRCRKVRDIFLADGRRMSFKNLNDDHRQRALIPFLEATEFLEGHVVAVAVTKDLNYLSTHYAAINIWKDLFGLSANWNDRAFEQMARITHFFSLFLSAWSSPGANISWITDEDEIVANAGRLEDAHQFAARLSGVYLSHDLGAFMMNTPAIVSTEPVFEDFLAIPDLAAGMIGEILAIAPTRGTRSPGLDGQKELTQKSDIIADWFWHKGGSLKKTCILIDRATKDQFSIGVLNIGQE